MFMMIVIVTQKMFRTTSVIALENSRLWAIDRVCLLEYSLNIIIDSHYQNISILRVLSQPQFLFKSIILTLLDSLIIVSGELPDNNDEVAVDEDEVVPGHSCLFS